MKRRKALKILCIILTVCVLLGISGYITVRYITNKYTVNTVIVEGNVHYSDEAIAELVTEGALGNNSLYLSVKYKNLEIKNIPFIETINVEIEAPDTIHVYVYEKTLAGFVEYLGRYVYFDKDGIVVEVSNVKTAGIPEVVGVKFDYIILYEKLPAKDEELFSKVLTLTKLMSKYEVDARQMYFTNNGETVLYKDDIIIKLGTDKNLDVKIMNLPAILEKLEGMKGTLKMENYDEETKRVSFEPFQ